jgi:hypothetical protein
MSDLGSYSFLPWLRRGIANSITAAPAGAARAAVGVDLTLTGDKIGGGTLTHPVHRDVQLYGPGDVIGLDPRAIVRREPRDWITDFEPNYLPFVEFYDEDLPWRYTPAPPDGSKRLTPWLVLVVLTEEEFADGTAGGKPLSFVTVQDTGAFPTAAELWAWAHVHVNRDLAAPGEVLSDDLAAVLTRFDSVLGANPDLGLSRVVSPRKLVPNTGYHAFLMPSFESGRLAGLGLDPDGTPAATASAWGSYPDRPEPANYGYYHRWYFRTGNVGDFEYLVRLLKPRPMDPAVGQRDLDVLHPLPGLPGIDRPGLAGVLRLGGALRIPALSLDVSARLQAQRYENWDTPFPQPFQTALADLIELGSDYASGAATDPDPMVTPPLYGQWHAQTSRLLEAGTPGLHGNWVHELNLDPRFRVPAGFGTAVVQDNQEAYVAAAWNQIGAVLEANRRIRFGQLARAVSGSLHRRHLGAQLAADPGRLLAITAPVHGRIVLSGVSLAHGISTSLIADGPLTVAMRRIVRPGSTVVRAVTRNGGPPNRLLAALAVGKAVAAQPKAAPPGIVTSAGLQRALAKHRQSPAFQLSLDERKPEIVTRLPNFSRFTLLDPGRDVPRLEPTATDSRDGIRFKAATAANAQLVQASAEAGREVVRPPVDVDDLASGAVKLLHPDLTVPRRVLAGLRIPDRLRPVVVEQFREVMAYPEIDLPMYKPLADKSSELFLPNLGRIPPNSISLLETNQRFIEAYLVGLNHEMARELLWREYPTDQQGSYFRQFWDPSFQLPTAGESAADRRERLRDVPPLHQWSLTSTLGSHDQREAVPGSTEDDVVLVIRGDLLKRYPTAVIYAQRAKWRRTAGGAIDPSAERELDDLTPAEELNPPLSKLRTPLFGAKVDPDIYFFGFDLTAEAARGQDASVPNADPGWFFVIRERPGEPRFGLDIERSGKLNVWNDFAWADVALDAPFIPVGASATTHHLAEPTGADIEKHEQWTEDRSLHWGPDLNSSEIAYILYQAPVLVAVHAQEMLGHD